MNANDVFVWLVERGIAVTAHGCASGIAYYPKDGFYKSDGLACIVDGKDGPELHGRYGEVTKIESPWDVVASSMEWHEFSRDRFDGWRDPPPHWESLYAELKCYGPTEAGRKALEGK